ncbi:MAG: YeeE/YedE thiosulfate transporter family protein [Xanthomonadales bacterium]|nr:YeeE/YedE thiosulfate transporter family protein [Xanthomonadales bacterium]
MNEPVISWKTAGIALGLLLTLATALVKPLGVSTQYVLTDAIVLHEAAPALAEGNEYLARYGEKSDWGIGYGWMLVLGMFVGGGVSAFLTGRFRPRPQQSMPPMWASRFGNSPAKRYLHAFLGGVLLLFGARMAGGCTSGHMISGIAQLTIGSFVFGVAIFASGIAVAKSMYKSVGGDA